MFKKEDDEFSLLEDKNLGDVKSVSFVLYGEEIS